MNEMNEMNNLETQLRTWVPRRLSPKLKQRLFAHQTQAVTAAEAPSAPLFRLNWLAPAMAAFVMMCVLFNQRHGGSFASSSNSGPMVALILSNQSAAAYLPGSFERQHNHLGGETFESTNGSSSTSSISSLPRLRGKSE